jgi:hypothetical protein
MHLKRGRDESTLFTNDLDKNVVITFSIEVHLSCSLNQLIVFGIADALHLQESFHRHLKQLPDCSKPIFFELCDIDGIDSSILENFNVTLRNGDIIFTTAGSGSTSFTAVFLAFSLRVE